MHSSKNLLSERNKKGLVLKIGDIDIGLTLDKQSGWEILKSLIDDQIKLGNVDFKYAMRGL